MFLIQKVENLLRWPRLSTKSIKKGHKEPPPMSTGSKKYRPGFVPRLVIAVAALSATVGIAACGGDDSASGSGGGNIDLVAYSTPQQAFEAGKVAQDWNTGPTKGIISSSVVSIATRPGNPENIQSFDDLLTKDVEIITPNPATSGGAKWNIMAIYGSQIEAGKSEQEALDAVATVISKTSVLDDSARDSLQTFASGKGDVLVGYENEAIQAQDEGIDLEYVLPDSTIRIENPAAVTTEAQDPKAARAFLDFILTDEGQQVFADYGYRPVTQSVLQKNADKFPDVPGLFTIADFGGWSKVDDEFFDDENGKVTQILRDQGAPLE